MGDKKMPETTIATLDMEGSGSLTLTNKHLRGQVLRFIQQGVKQQEQIDVLLSAIGGYSVIDIPMKAARITAVTVCTLAGGVCWFISPIITLLAIGVGIVLWKMIRDQIVLQLNIMGGKFNVPFKTHLAPKVREFITQLQQAKTEYEESNG